MDKIFESTKSPLTVVNKKHLAGPFARMDEFNNNGRNYPTPVYKPAAEALLPKIHERRLMGELDHPMAYDEVRLTNVSHVITECVIHDSGEVTGKVELLDTPAGLVAQALVEAGVPLGISSRGLGATRKVNEGVEVTKLKLITFDLVAEPSFGNAILLNESAYQGLQKDLDRIESTLPLNESVESDSVRKMIERMRESVQLEPDMSDSSQSSDEAIVAILESELTVEDEKSLRESLEMKDDEIEVMTGLVEARDEELRISNTIVKNQQRIIENLKTKLINNGADPAELAALVESVGVITMEKMDLEERITSLTENMDSLQEEYNRSVEEGNVSKGDAEKLKESVGEMEEEIVDLRKRLAVESKGLSWKKVGPLLEGLTTEREINEKLASISHLGSGSARLSADRVAKTLTESQLQNASGKRLSSIISRV